MSSNVAFSVAVTPRAVEVRRAGSVDRDPALTRRFMDLLKDPNGAFRVPPSHLLGMNVSVFGDGSVDGLWTAVQDLKPHLSELGRKVAAGHRFPIHAD